MATKTTKAKRRIFRQFSPQDGDSGGLGWHHPQLNCRLAPPDVKRLVHKPNFGWLCRWRFKTSSYKEICKPLKEVGSQKFGCSAGRFSGRAAGGWKPSGYEKLEVPSKGTRKHGNYLRTNLKMSG
jgi:hypothetical protein